MVDHTSVYIRFSEEIQLVAETLQPHDSVLIDLDDLGGLIGIEIIDPPGIPRFERPSHTSEEINDE